jgi:hypothetical protein
MELLTNNSISKIGNAVSEYLSQAKEAMIFVAYFSPNDSIMRSLRKIPQLSLLISDDFTINNPYKLNDLKRNSTIRCVPKDCPRGKLHSKVIHGTREDGSSFVILGSANMTNNGLYSNQETCVLLDSNIDADQPILVSIFQWLDDTWKQSEKGVFQFSIAKKIFDNSSHKWHKKNNELKNLKFPVQYWILKTTEGSRGDSHWHEFIAANIISIGWEDINIDPSKVSKENLAKIAEAAYPDENGKIAADTIKKFTDIMKLGDLVLICKGYNANHPTPVFVNGIARIKGPFNINNRLDWRFTHQADIQLIEKYIPRNLLASSLRKESLTRTIHQVDEPAFMDLTSKLHDDFGVVVNV